MVRPPMRRALLVAVAAAALVLATVASATIVPQKGIAGVNIGMSQAKVRMLLGKPAKVKHGTDSFGPYTQFKYAGLTVMFQGNKRVTQITTTRSSEKTTTGAGVGSTEAQLRAKVKGLTCKTESGSRHCYLGSFKPHERVTDFSIKKGRVFRVVVGIVTD
jgi:hypothetical protein